MSFKTDANTGRQVRESTSAGRRGWWFPVAFGFLWIYGLEITSLIIDSETLHSMMLGGAGAAILAVFFSGFHYAERLRQLGKTSRIPALRKSRLPLR